MRGPATGVGGRFRVLHVSPYPPTRSGIATYGHDFAAALEGMPDRIELLRFRETPQRPLEIPTVIHEVLAFHDALRESTPDVVHIETGFGLLREFYILLSLPASREYSVVVTAHDAPCLAGEPLWFLGRADAAGADPPGVLGPRAISEYSFAVERHAYAQADAVLALSTAGLTRLAGEFGPHPGLERVPHGVQIPVDATRTPAGPLRVLYFGYFHPNKGVDTLVRALSGLPEGSVTVSFAGEPYRLTHDGEQTNVQFLEAVVRQTQAAGFPHPVRWLGYVPDSAVSDLFNAHDVLVLPYRDSGLSATSGVLYRGMAHGLAILATKVQALPEFIHDNVTGLLVDANRPDALVDKLRQLVMDRDLVRRLGTRAREFVRTYHAWPVVAHTMCRIYDNLRAERCPSAVPAGRQETV